MVASAAGQVVPLPFPFSDLSRSKLRPALLVADAGRGDWIACQITSNPYSDGRAVLLTQADFTMGGLQRDSYARPGSLLTANETLFAATAGSVKPGRLESVKGALIAIIRQ